MNVTMGRTNQRKYYQIYTLWNCVNGSLRTSWLLRSWVPSSKNFSRDTDDPDRCFRGFSHYLRNKRCNKFLQYTTNAPSHAISLSLFILLSHSTLHSLRNDRVHKLQAKKTHTHIAGNWECSATTSCDTPVAHVYTNAQEQTVVIACPGTLKAQVPWTKPKWLLLWHSLQYDLNLIVEKHSTINIYNNNNNNIY